VDELNGRMLANQILLAGLIARVASDKADPVRFLSDFRDEIKAVIAGVRIAGLEDARTIRSTAHSVVDELFALMKPPGDQLRNGASDD
jgi:hypothetical protein